MMEGKMFSPVEALLLEEVILHRRDVRGNRFINKPVEDEKIEKILFAALNAPSVGFSQPWEFVIIKEQHIKNQVKQSFDEANILEAACFEDEKQKDYIRLKLEGIIEAPINMAVFYKPAVVPVLGQTNMKEAGLYSVVCAIQNMWLMARAMNIGMGWVSILDPQKVKTVLNAPSENQLVAYLCIGYVDHFLSQPELELLQWERRKEKEAVVFKEGYQ